MQAATRILRALAWISGFALIAAGLWAFWTGGAIVPPLIVSAPVVVGPVEDLVKMRLRLPGVEPMLTEELVNQAPSPGFIRLPLAELLLSR